MNCLICDVKLDKHTFHGTLDCKSCGLYYLLYHNEICGININGADNYLSIEYNCISYYLSHKKIKTFLFGKDVVDFSLLNDKQKCIELKKIVDNLIFM